MNSVVTTLLEGDYVLGVGALVNSLYKHGFRGTVYAGYRGELTGWASTAESREGYREVRPTDNLVIKFIPVDSEWHLANVKPHFMLRALEEFEPDAEAVFYFDPDIVTTCRWTFYEEWVGYGVALCEEINYFPMASTHPIRKAWQKWLAHNGYREIHPRNHYLNSGFVGVLKTDCSFLHVWRELHTVARDSGESMTRFHWSDNTQLLRGVDQDLLSCTTMVSDHSISIVGPDGMGFTRTGFAMEHATSSPKPWRKRYFRSALRGHPPSRAEKGWLQHTDFPISVLPARKRKYLRIVQIVGSVIGRFVRRT